MAAGGPPRVLVLCPANLSYSFPTPPAAEQAQDDFLAAAARVRDGTRELVSAARDDAAEIARSIRNDDRRRS